MTTQQCLRKMTNEELLKAIDYFIDKISQQDEFIRIAMMPKFNEFSYELKRRGL